MYDPYDDSGFMSWLENTERGMLELAYLELRQKYIQLKREHEKYVSDVGWERTARQQKRSGGWM